jgi:hypothetical protein
MPDNEISQSGGLPPLPSVSVVADPDVQSRCAVERCSGGGGRAVYAVLDMTRIVTHRVICRTNFADANMIRDALSNAGEEYFESHETLSDLVHLWSEHEALNGGGPGWQKRFNEAFMRACDLTRREP